MDKLVKDGNIQAKFFRLKSRKTQPMAIMRVCWREYNKLFFDQMLEEPNFNLYTDPKEKYGSWEWRDNKRTLWLNLTEFEVYEPFRHTLLHEMCHQATRELDKMLDPNIVHGPHWIAWATKCEIEIELD